MPGHRFDALHRCCQNRRMIKTSEDGDKDSKREAEGVGSGVGAMGGGGGWREGSWGGGVV